MAMTVMTHDEEIEVNRMVMRWYGWGSPVGLGLFALCLGISAELIRLAVFGL